jgi:hypothetical protein
LALAGFAGCLDGGGVSGATATGVGVAAGSVTGGWPKTTTDGPPAGGVRASPGVGSTLGDGATAGDSVGVGSAAGVVVGTGVPGVEVPGSGDDAGVGSGTVVVAVGAGDTKAIPGVGPPAVSGVDWIPTIPKVSATLAKTRLITPSVKTSRSR